MNTKRPSSLSSSSVLNTSRPILKKNEEKYQNIITPVISFRRLFEDPIKQATLTYHLFDRSYNTDIKGKLLEVVNFKSTGIDDDGRGSEDKKIITTITQILSSSSGHPNPILQVSFMIANLVLKTRQ